MEEEDRLLIEGYVSREMRPRLEREYISLAHTFSLLKRDPQEAFENLFIIMFMAPLLVGRGDIARRNLLLLKGLVDLLEKKEKKSDLAVRIIETFYEEFDSVIRKINKVQQVYGIDIDLSFLKYLDMKK
ncbi:MAG: hypothetical protein JRJ26_14140 [Deltaproteobacteria bacterium]|nr:hypothetical protein [Deltaproteobacteria bacterium]